MAIGFLGMAWASSPAVAEEEPVVVIPADPEKELLRQRLERAEAELQSIRAQLGPSATEQAVPVADQTSEPVILTPEAADILNEQADDNTASAGQSEELSPDFGGLTPEESPPSARFNMPAPPLTFPLTNSFGNGFELKTKDDEYTIQFHNLTQVDGRFYEQRNQAAVKDTFTIPRQWFIFSGRLTKPIEYYVAFAEGFDTLNLLDCFVNFHYSDKLQLKVGRYKTPFTYEFYALPINGLITPERSLFFNNFGLNRDLGVMPWGTLLDKRVEYAAGIFNGTRNGYLDANSAKDFLGYVNFRPWVNNEDCCLEYFNFGGSMMFGYENNRPIPQTLRTSVATTGNEILGVPFLTFRDAVVENGERQFYSLHSAWYYQQLSLVGEWQSGYQSYNFRDSGFSSTQVPVQSYYVQSGYFLTGETVSGRGMVKPIRPFDIRKGKFGWGAWEPMVRFNYLDIGRTVFTLGYSDPNLYANRVTMVDVGVNWYLTQYLKFVFEWEHAEFNEPVAFAPGRRQLTSDLFLCRLQLFF